LAKEMTYMGHQLFLFDLDECHFQTVHRLRPQSPATPVASIAPVWEQTDVQQPRSANL
jgi:hypothetical protein